MTGAEWLAVAILLAVSIWTVATIIELHKLIPRRNKDCQWPMAYVAGERKFKDMIGSSFPIDMQYNSEPHRVWSFDMETIEHRVFAAATRRGKSVFQDRLLPIDNPRRALEIMQRNYRNLEAFREAYREQMTDSGIAADAPDPRTLDLIRRFGVAKMRAFRRGVCPLGAYSSPVHRSVAKHSQTGH